jgi:predicted metal-dependent hydrolase
MAKSEGKILTDPEIGEVHIVKSVRGRRISIRVHPVRGVRVSVPRLVPYAAAIAFFKLKRGWVLEVMARQKERFKDVPSVNPAEIAEMRRRAKAELPVRLAELASRYGFVYNRVAIKHNSTNWGSCSSKNNINLNLNIVRLPSVLRDYILLHELCHLRHHDHGHAFHLLLEHLLTDNLMKLLADPDVDSQTKDIARKSAVSKARFPIDYTMSRAIKEYKLV